MGFILTYWGRKTNEDMKFVIKMHVLVILLGAYDMYFAYYIGGMSGFTIGCITFSFIAIALNGLEKMKKEIKIYG